MPGFWDGVGRVVVRFSPNEVGEWDFRVTSNLAAYSGKTGTFTASASEAPGFIRTANVHHFAYTENAASSVDGPRCEALPVSGRGGDSQDRRARADEDSTTSAALCSAGTIYVKPSHRIVRTWPISSIWTVRALHPSEGMPPIWRLPAASTSLRTFPTGKRERLVRALVAITPLSSITWQALSTLKIPPTRAVAQRNGNGSQKIDPINTFALPAPQRASRVRR